VLLHGGSLDERRSIVLNVIDVDMTKKRFLAVYDYGSGGIWVSIFARSVEEIERKFRDLEVL
jgi:hypothetical protein